MQSNISLPPASYEFGMPVHPVCELLPLMDSVSLHNLATDIRRNGLLVPIVVHDGQLVDGRNRILACQLAQVEPQSVGWRDIYQGEQSIARWIWSINAERRHLTTDQIIAIEIELCGWEKREAAKSRQVAAGREYGRISGKSGGRGHKKIPQTDGVAKPKRAPAVRALLAQQLGVSENKVQQALNLQKAQPELLKAVALGKVSLWEVTRRVTPTLPRLMRHEKESALYNAMVRLANTKYTPKEIVEWCSRQPFHAALAAVVNRDSLFCLQVRKEIVRERDQRKPPRSQRTIKFEVNHG